MVFNITTHHRVVTILCSTRGMRDSFYPNTFALPIPCMMESRTAPDVYTLDGFLVEAYNNISDIPFCEAPSTAPEKNAEQERADELYGSCRTCFTHREDESLLLCDDCDKAFHLGCLIPAKHEAPKGEWLCAWCTRRRAIQFHRRAHAIARMRTVEHDIRTRPCLPPRLRLKMLAIGKRGDEELSCRPPRKRNGVRAVIDKSVQVRDKAIREVLRLADDISSAARKKYANVHLDELLKMRNELAKQGRIVVRAKENARVAILVGRDVSTQMLQQRACIGQFGREGVHSKQRRKRFGQFAQSVMNTSPPQATVDFVSAGSIVVPKHSRMPRGQFANGDVP